MKEKYEYVYLEGGSAVFSGNVNLKEARRQYDNLIQEKRDLIKQGFKCVKKEKDKYGVIDYTFRRKINEKKHNFRIYL